MQKLKVLFVLMAMMFVMAACSNDTDGDDEDPLPDVQGELTIEPSSIEEDFNVNAFEIESLRLLFEDADGNVVTIIPDASMITGDIPSTPGEHTVTVEYNGLETSFTVTLIEPLEYQLQTLYDMGVSEGLIDADSYEEWLDSIAGEDGRGIESLEIDDRELIVTFDDGESASLGIIVPEDPRSIESTDLTDSQLTITYDDGTEDTFVLDMPTDTDAITGTAINEDGYLEVTYADGTTETLGRVSPRDIEFDVTDDTLRWRYTDESEWNDLHEIDDWMQEDEYVTVTLKYLDDHVFDEFEIRRGESFVSDAPSMIGHVFNGWAADRDGSERVGPNTPVYDDVVLHANFVTDESFKHLSFDNDYNAYMGLDDYAKFTPNQFDVSGGVLIIPDKVMTPQGDWIPLAAIGDDAFRDNQNLEKVHVLSETYIEFYANVFRNAQNLEHFEFEHMDDLTVVLRERVFRDTPSLVQDMEFPTDTNLNYLRDSETVIKSVSFYNVVSDDDGVGYQLRVRYSDGDVEYFDLNVPDDDEENIRSIDFTSDRRDELRVDYKGAPNETFSLDTGAFLDTTFYQAWGVFRNSGITSFSILGEYDTSDDFTMPYSNIPSYAFAGAANLEFIRLPDAQVDHDLGQGHTTSIFRWNIIRDYAFKGTESLESFDFDGFRSVRSYAFKNSGIKEANFHLDIEERDGTFRWVDLSEADYAFKGSDVEVVRFADGQEAVPEGFLMNTESLETIEIPIQTLTGALQGDGEPALTRFETRAFKNSNLSEIEFPTRGRDTLTFEDITYFGKESLAGTQFESIEIGDNATVKEGAFRGIEPLTTFVWNASVNRLPDYLLADTPNLETVELPDRVVELGEGFLYNSGIETFHVSGHMQVIGDYAFKDSAISTIEFGKVDNQFVEEGEASSLQSIGESAFENTANLESITLPLVFHPSTDAHILNVGSYAFRDSGLIHFESLHDHTEFGHGAFEAARDLETFVWHGQAESIADQMFAGATSLHTLEMPDTIEYIGQSAFFNTNLTTFELPSSITEIGPRAFRNTALETFEFPDDTNLTHIGMNAFQGVEAELHIVFPSTLESLGRAVFQGSNVVHADFSATSITEIPIATFSSAEMLEEVRLNKQTEVIEEGAFRNTYALASFEIGPESDPFDRSFEFQLPEEHSLTTIERGAFINSGLETLELPPSVEVIESTAFRTSALQTIVLSESLHTLEADAFRGAQQLESVIFTGTNLTTLQSGTFRHTLSLDSLTLPPSITTIEDDAFEDTHLEFLRLSPVHVGNLETFIDDLDTLRELRFTPTVDVPDDMTTFPAVFEFNDTIEIVDVPSGITAMEPETFRGAYSLQRVFLPSTLESIPRAAFAFTHELELVTPGVGIESIERDAFFSSGIQNFDLPDSVEFIGRHAFRNTVNLSTLNHDPQESALETIGSGAFRGSGLEHFIIPEATRTIETKAFAETASLSTLTLPDTLEDVGTYLLEDSGVESVTYEHMSETLPEGIFYNAANLETVDFTDDPVIESFAPYAFSGTESITEFTLPDSMIETGEAAFKGHPTLERIYLNETLETISPFTFDGATALFEVDVPNHDDPDGHALTHIGEAAFRDTESLSFFFVGEHLEYIGDHAFENSNFNPAPANLPSSLRLVGDYAFAGSDITDFHVTEYLLTIGAHAFESSALSSLTFTDEHDVFIDFEGEIPDDGEGMVIGDSAFRDTHLETVELPFYVVMIGESAFRDNESLESVDTTDAGNLFIIEANAFRNTPSLTDFNLPDTLAYLGDYAFAETGPIETFIIPQFQPLQQETDLGISQLGEGILHDSAVRNVDIRGVFDVIPSFAFARMSDFESITFHRPTAIRSIGARAFYQTEQMTGLPDLPNLTTIGREAFVDTQIDTFSFSEAIGLIGEGAFRNTPLESVDFDLDNETPMTDGLIIEAEAFYGTRFTTFEAPETLMHIGAMAFGKSDLEMLYLTSETQQVRLDERFARIGDRYDPFLESSLLSIIVEEEVYHLYEADRQWTPYFDIIEYE